MAFVGTSYCRFHNQLYADFLSDCPICVGEVYQSFAERRKRMETSLDCLREIAKVLKTSGKDAKAFDEGNNAAGTRTRKRLQEIKLLCQQGRELVTIIKNGG